MNGWTIWMALAGGVVILEMFTGTFYLLMISFGMAAGGLAALTGASGAAQLVLASVIGLVATYVLHRSKLGKTSRTDAASDPNVNLDIGQTLIVEKWQNAGGEVHTARVMYRGAMWDVELQQGIVAQPGAFVIQAVRGSRLVVGNSVLHNN